MMASRPDIGKVVKQAVKPPVIRKRGHKETDMAFSRLRLREALREYNHVAFMDEKKLKDAREQAKDALVKLTELRTEWEATNRGFKTAKIMAPAIVVQLKRVAEAQNTAIRTQANLEWMIGNLDTPGHYQQFLDDIDEQLRSKPDDKELSDLKAAGESINAERNVLYERAQRLVKTVSAI